LGGVVLLVEISVPKSIYRKFYMWKKSKVFGDVILEVSSSRGSGVTRVFIKNTPKGWWLALRILREGAGDLYMLKKVGYMDIPSKVLEIGMKDRWSPIYEGIIGEELRKWGLVEDEQEGGYS
jgi:hypothetical protein